MRNIDKKKIVTRGIHKRNDIHMNGPEKTQIIPSLSEIEDLQEIGEERIEDVRGGVLTTPGRGVGGLRRSASAPGKLQGNVYPIPPGSPPRCPSSSSQSIRTQRSAPSPQSIRSSPSSSSLGTPSPLSWSSFDLGGALSPDSVLERYLRLP